MVNFTGYFMSCQTWFKFKQLTHNCHSNNRFVFVATLQNTWSGWKFENFIMSWHWLYSIVQHWHWTPMQSTAESGVSDHVRSWNFGKVNFQAFYWLTVKNTVLSLVDTDAFLNPAPCSVLFCQVGAGTSNACSFQIWVATSSIRPSLLIEIKTNNCSDNGFEF